MELFEVSDEGDEVGVESADLEFVVLEVILHIFVVSFFIQSSVQVVNIKVTPNLDQLFVPLLKQVSSLTLLLTDDLLDKRLEFDVLQFLVWQVLMKLTL